MFGRLIGVRCAVRRPVAILQRCSAYRPAVTKVVAVWRAAALPFRRFASAAPPPPPAAANSPTTAEAGSSDDAKRGQSPTVANARNREPTLEEIENQQVKDEEFIKFVQGFEFVSADGKQSAAPTTGAGAGAGASARHAFALGLGSPITDADADAAGSTGDAVSFSGSGTGIGRGVPLTKPSYRGRVSAGGFNTPIPAGTVPAGKLSSAQSVALFSLHARQPNVWTPEKLAARYQLPAHVVETILRTAAAPYVRFDADQDAYVATAVASTADDDVAPIPDDPNAPPPPKSTAPVREDVMTYADFLPKQNIVVTSR